MGHAAVDDVHLLDLRFQGIECRFDLGDHPRIDCAIGNQLAALTFGQMRHKRLGIGSVAVNARHIAEENQLFSVENSGDGGRRGIGVDVVLLPVFVEGDRGNDRNGSRSAVHRDQSGAG